MKPKKPIESIILTLRGQKVILDADLAELYGVAAYRLNEQVKRNPERFPEDFVFQLTQKEWLVLRSQFVTANSETTVHKADASNSSQIAMSSTEAATNEADASMWPQIVTTSAETFGNKRHRGAAYRPYAFTEHGAIMAATVLNSPEAVAMSLYVVRAFVQMRGVLAANAEILKRLAEIDKTLLTPKRRIGFHTDAGEAQGRGKRI